MNIYAVVFACIVALASFAGAIFCRRRFNIAIKGADIGVTVVVFAAALVATGQVRELAFGSGVVTLFDEPIRIPAREILPRSTPEKLPLFLGKIGDINYTVIPINCDWPSIQTEPRAPKLGKEGSDTGPFTKFLTAFSPYEATDYMVFVQTDSCSEVGGISVASGSSRFVAMMTFADFRFAGWLMQSRNLKGSSFESAMQPLSMEELQHIIDNDDRLLTHLVSYVSTKNAVLAEESRIEVISRMVDIDKQALPIIHPNGEFASIIQREKLASALVVDIGRLLSD